MTKEVNIHFHPGIYRFLWPYLAANFSRNDKQEVAVYHCDVEIRVGQDEDMQVGKLVTIIVTARDKTPGVQNFIEHIATKIRLSFFDAIFHEKHWEKPIISENSIRWIERHLFSQHPGSTMDDEINEVIMKWDDVRHAYHSPTWRSME
ncbi:hypothetical protein D3C75_241880 [compost metagenome]